MKPVSVQTGPDITTLANALPAGNQSLSQQAEAGLMTAKKLQQKLERKYRNNQRHDERDLLTLARTLVIQLGGSLPNTML